MRSRHTQWMGKAALTSALLTLAGLTVLTPAQAQQSELDLGSVYYPMASGMATLTDTGTTASGTYTYDGGSTGKSLKHQTDYFYWNTYGPSTTNVSGGSITFLYTYATSTATISGGDIFSLSTLDTSTAAVSGGSFYGIDTDSTSTANISGGDIHYLETYDISTTNISGGSITELQTVDASTVNINGGSILYLGTFYSSTANVSGGSISNLETYNASTLDLLGTGFTTTFVDAVPNYVQYEVTGTLQDGTLIDALYNNHGGSLLFNGQEAVPPLPAVPEASTTVSFGLLLVLGLGGLAMSARRRKAMVAG